MVLKIHGSYILLVYITMYQVPGMKWTLSAILCSLPAAGLFSRSRLRDTQGTCLCTMVQVWVPAGLRGAYSGRSKSRNLASNHGVAFRGAKAEQSETHMSAVVLHCCKSSLLGGSHGTRAVPHQFVWTTTMRVWTLHMRVCSVCCMTRVLVCRCVRVLYW